MPIFANKLDTNRQVGITHKSLCDGHLRYWWQCPTPVTLLDEFQAFLPKA
ncbi:hypothetical protein [Nostoc sp.]